MGLQLDPTSAAMGSMMISRRPRRTLTTPTFVYATRVDRWDFFFQRKGKIAHSLSIIAEGTPVLHWLAGGGVGAGAYWRQTVRSSQLSA